MLFIFSSACAAHQERILKLEDSGAIADIPAEYGPGKFMVVFQNKAVSSAQLTLGGKSTKIPSCILRLLKSGSANNIQITASWYHEETNLPFYLNIDFLDADQNLISNYKNSYSLFFNLRTSKLIDLTRNLAVNNGNSLQRMEINIDTICIQSEARRVTGKK